MANTQNKPNRSAEEKKERRRREREFQRQLHPWTRRRVTSWALFVVAFVMAVQHLVAHLGYRPVPMNMGQQDILIGWPMAGVLALVGLMTIDPPAKATKDRRR